MSQNYLQELHDTVAELAPGASSAFVVGSGTGALAFELSKSFARIIASDFCGQFVSTSEKIQKGTVFNLFLI